MPKGSKSVGALCGELGMDAVAENYFRKDSQSYVKENIADVPNATDEVIEELALTFLNDGAGEKYFSFDAALNYQWEASEHRLTIIRYVGDIMKQQRWYIIDRLHKRFNGAINCPGCLLHKARAGAGVNGRAGSISSEASDADSIHHVASMENGLQGSESRKRSYRDDVVLESKRRKSNMGEGSNGMVGGARGHSQAIAYSNMPPLPPTGASGFTPVNPTGVAVILHSSVPPIPSLAQTTDQFPNPLSASLAMRYRGKLWHFQSIAHKARVIEQILLKEEKEVESYPILAFAKGAKKAATASGEENDSDHDESALKDYFRMYTHFMNERFPGNEKVLLENGVAPSAN